MEPLGHATVGEDVGEKEFSSRFQYAKDLTEHRPFVEGEVQDAIGHDDIDRIVIDSQCPKILHITLAKIFPKLQLPHHGLPSWSLGAREIIFIFTDFVPLVPSRSQGLCLSSRAVCPVQGQGSRHS
uniref:Uncharacterized protein n=1 Tax=Candidatus Kentrum sp. LFY TaxID=2126342 RepID=A0A450UR13_9GAMM|nr:MAG: hypothetical protein BECKLFY1418B_GA0070995_106418 [Candidatus Kentron sp. LFY]